MKHMCRMMNGKNKYVILILGVIVICILGRFMLNENRTVREQADKIIYTYYYRGDLSTAIKKFENLLKKTEKKNGEDFKSIISLNSDLASLYAQVGRFEDAEECLVKSEKLVRDSGLSEWPIEAFYKTYGQYEWLQKNHDKALEYYQKAVEWCERQYGNNSTQAGSIYLTMSYIYLEINELKDAEECVKLADIPLYQDHERFLKINVAITLGDIRMKQENYELAVSYYEHAYRIFRDTFDSGNQASAFVRNSIEARLQEAESKLDKR